MDAILGSLGDTLSGSIFVKGSEWCPAAETLDMIDSGRLMRNWCLDHAA